VFRKLADQLVYFGSGSQFGSHCPIVKVREQIENDGKHFERLRMLCTRRNDSCEQRLTLDRDNVTLRFKDRPHVIFAAQQNDAGMAADAASWWRPAAFCLCG
jgi:hypothetical protein